MPTTHPADRLLPQPLPPLRPAVRRAMTVLASLFAGFFLLARTASALVFQVNSLLDSSDVSQGDGTCSIGATVIEPGSGPRPLCTLRAAIQEANASAGRDTIRFRSSLLYTGPLGSATLPLTSNLPSISDPVDLDGTTAPGWRADGLAPLVNLVGSGGAVYGLSFSAGADGSSVRGLGLHGFAAAGIEMTAAGVWIDACGFGMYPDATGWIHAPNGVGIVVRGADAWIGAKVDNGAFVGQGNHLPANGVAIQLEAPNAHVLGNRIGTFATDHALVVGPDGTVLTGGTVQDGIRVHVGTGVEIGHVIETGSAPNVVRTALGNVILGSGGHGVYVEEIGVAPDGEMLEIVANRIGVDGNDALVFGSDLSGLYVHRAVSPIRIGDGSTEGANVVGGNEGDGIELGLGGVGRVEILANRVGVKSAGLLPAENGFQGIRIDGGDPVWIEGNTVGWSPHHGILIGEDPSADVGRVDVVGNFVGVNESGQGIGNTLAGIRVARGEVSLRRNTVGGNRTGIELGETASGIEITENFVGTDALGRDQGNSNVGIFVSSTNGANRIGRPGAGNVIGWNGASGIVAYESAAPNEIVGNTIGVGPTGLPMPNGVHGIQVRNQPTLVWPPGAHGTVVIGSDVAAPGQALVERANRIVYHPQDAISIEAGADAVARGNQFGDNAHLALDLNQDGISPNDDGDADTGANGLLNTPDLEPVRSRLDPATGELLLEYRLTTDPAEADYPLTVDFYTTGPDQQEPRVWVGSDRHPAADAGQWRRVRIQPATALPAGESTVVAVATTSSNQTSEVSFPIVVPEPGIAVGLISGCLGLAALKGRRGHSARVG